MFYAQSGSAALQNHVKGLQDAPALTATLTAQQIGGAPETFKIAFSKPNLLRIETPAGWTLSDGKTIYSYSKKDNAWTERPLDSESLKQSAGLNEVFAWRAFFDKDALKSVVTAKSGANRVIKGTPTTELALTFENGTATLFIDPKLGVARGFTYKAGETDLLVTSTDMQIGREPMPATAFAFIAPEGAKLQEAPKADEITFAQVQTIMNRNCLPCHGPQQRSGGYELTSYQGIMQGVSPGNPGESRVLAVVSGPNPTMPKMRPPLRQADVDAISKWIELGAKRP